MVVQQPLEQGSQRGLGKQRHSSRTASDVPGDCSSRGACRGNEQWQSLVPAWARAPWRGNEKGASAVIHHDAVILLSYCQGKLKGLLLPFFFPLSCSHMPAPWLYPSWLCGDWCHQQKAASCLGLTQHSQQRSYSLKSGTKISNLPFITV